MMISRPTETRARNLESELRSATSGDPMAGKVACDFFEYLEEGLAVTGCDHSFRCSEAFLAANDLVARPILLWLARHGARCDCEVLEEFEHQWLSESLDAG